MFQAKNSNDASPEKQTPPFQKSFSLFDRIGVSSPAGEESPEESKSRRASGKPRLGRFKTFAAATVKCLEVERKLREIDTTRINKFIFVTNSVSMTDKERTNYAATKIQAAARRWHARRLVEILRQDFALNFMNRINKSKPQVPNKWPKPEEIEAGKQVRKALTDLWCGLGMEKKGGEKGYITHVEWQILLRELIKIQLPEDEVEKMELDSTYTISMAGITYNINIINQTVRDQYELDFQNKNSLDFEEYVTLMMVFAKFWTGENFYQSFVAKFFRDIKAKMHVRMRSDDWLPIAEDQEYVGWDKSMLEPVPDPRESLPHSQSVSRAPSGHVTGSIPGSRNPSMHASRVPSRKGSRAGIESRKSSRAGLEGLGEVEEEYTFNPDSLSGARRSGWSPGGAPRESTHSIAARSSTHSVLGAAFAGVITEKLRRASEEEEMDPEERFVKQLEAMGENIHPAAWMKYFMQGVRMSAKLLANYKACCEKIVKIRKDELWRLYEEEMLRRQRELEEKNRTPTPDREPVTMLVKEQKLIEPEIAGLASERSLEVIHERRQRVKRDDGRISADDYDIIRKWAYLYKEQRHQKAMQEHFAQHKDDMEYLPMANPFWDGGVEESDEDSLPEVTEKEADIPEDPQPPELIRDLSLTELSPVVTPRRERKERPPSLWSSIQQDNTEGDGLQPPADQLPFLMEPPSELPRGRLPHFMRRKLANKQPKPPPIAKPDGPTSPATPPTRPLSHHQASSPHRTPPPKHPHLRTSDFNYHLYRRSPQSAPTYPHPYTTGRPLTGFPSPQHPRLQPGPGTTHVERSMWTVPAPHFQCYPWGYVHLLKGLLEEDQLSYFSSTSPANAARRKQSDRHAHSAETNDGYGDVVVTDLPPPTSPSPYHWHETHDGGDVPRQCERSPSRSSSVSLDLRSREQKLMRTSWLEFEGSQSSMRCDTPDSAHSHGSESSRRHRVSFVPYGGTKANGTNHTPRSRPQSGVEKERSPRFSNSSNQRRSSRTSSRNFSVEKRTFGESNSVDSSRVRRFSKHPNYSKVWNYLEVRDQQKLQEIHSPDSYAVTLKRYHDIQMSKRTFLEGKPALFESSGPISEEDLFPVDSKQ